MSDTLLDALTGRRLGGALFVLAGLIVAGVVLLRGGDGGGGSRQAEILPARIVSVPQLGLTFAYPSTWSRTVSGEVIRVRAPAGAAVMTFASPVEGRQDKRAKAATQDALRKRYAPAKVVRDGPARLGARKVSSFELAGRSGGAAVRALVLAGSSPYRTYVVTLLTPGRPSAQTLAQARQVLATVRLVRPEVPSKR